jgi:hypothetical protein
MEKINNFINESPLLAWGIWLAYAVIVSFGTIIYFYHNSILPTHYILNLAAVTTFVLLVPLLYWHSSQRDNAFFWRNTRLAIVGFFLIGVTLLMPIFLNVNYMSKNLDKTRTQVKELLAQKIKDFDSSNLFVLYFNPEQLINAIKKHNLEVDNTKKIEDQQDQSVSDKKDQEIIKALKNI